MKKSQKLESTLGIVVAIQMRMKKKAITMKILRKVALSSIEKA
jgi:hypothetical protein